MDTEAVIARRSGEADTFPLRARYFDTADRRLSAQNAALRVRLGPKGQIQTLKAGNGLVRAEWEWPVAGPEPDLGVIVEADARTVLGDLTVASLAPIFETRITRTTLLLDQGAIELAIDRGEIVGPDDAREPISEIELELNSGEPADLYRLALVLADAVPMTIEPRSKAARGFELAAGQPPKAVKARRLALTADTTVDSAMAAIFGGCFEQFTANLPCVLAGDDPEGIHQARVGLRRLRSAFGLFRHLLPRLQSEWLDSETRWLAGSLGGARDWDVFLAELLAPVKTAFAVHPELHDELSALEIAAQAHRTQSGHEARAALRSARHTRFHLRFGEWLEDRGWRAQPVTPVSAQLFRPLSETVGALLARRHRKARRAGVDFASLPYPERHRLRIALKKLRYAVDFFRVLYDEKPVARYLDQLSEFQDTLGHINDVASAARLVPEIAAAPDSHPGLGRALGIVIGWHGRGLAASEPRLVAEWQDFRTAKPFWHDAGHGGGSRP